MKAQNGFPDSGHNMTRQILRIVGPIVLIFGLVLLYRGFTKFGFPSALGFGPSWDFFVGMPLVFFGSAICKFAYMGAVSRYVAGEIAPVGKDVVNYMASETKDAVKEVANSVAAGLREGATATTDTKCPKCAGNNSPEANFCSTCGSKLSPEKCPACGYDFAPNAKFCGGCGGKRDS